MCVCVGDMMQVGEGRGGWREERVRDGRGRRSQFSGTERESELDVLEREGKTKGDAH